VSPSIGSIATGYGGLDAAVAAAFGAQVAWVADNDPDVAKILAARFGGVPNLGDVTQVSWSQVLALYGPVQILCAGFPCQDVSAAGLRAGLQPGNRSGLWFHIVQAIAVLKPEVVVLENVRGLLTAPAHSELEPCPICVGNSPARRLRALGAVLGNLADLGFDAEWQIVSAAAAGSCHQRERVFVLAWRRDAADAGCDARAQGHPDRPAAAGGC
jgi:DNA (cytosine-5)-methyltransferase 1